MSKENHSFSVEVAVQVGVPCALLLQHLSFLQKSAVRSGAAWQRVWVKRSAKALTVTYPYWTGKQISAALTTLESRGLIASKIDNEQKGDRSKSFILTASGLELIGLPFAEMANGHFPKGKMPFAEMENDICRNGKSIKVDYTDYTENIVVEKTTTTAAKPSTLEAKKEKEIQPGGAAAGAGRVDIAAEIERLKQDAAVRENFTMTRRIPAEKFETYVQDFSREVSGTAETYWRLADFRRHFFNWAEKHYLIEKAKATGIKPTTQAPRIRAGQD